MCDWVPSLIVVCSTVAPRKTGLAKLRDATAATTVINAGEGTTGLRWIQCLLDRAGIGAGRNSLGGATRNSLASAKLHQHRHSLQSLQSRPADEYISDTPVATNLFYLVETHPSARIIMSMRNATAWKRSRVAKHRRQHPRGLQSWFQAAPCGASNHGYDHEVQPPPPPPPPPFPSLLSSAPKRTVDRTEHRDGPPDDDPSFFFCDFPLFFWAGGVIPPRLSLCAAVTVDRVGGVASRHHRARLAYPTLLATLALSQTQQDVEITYMVYTAWVACYIPPERLFAFDVWRMPPEVLRRELRQFLAPVLPRDFTARSLSEECSP